MKKANVQSFIYIVIGLCLGMMGHFSYVGIERSGAEFFREKETMVMFGIVALTLVPLIAYVMKSANRHFVAVKVLVR